LDDFSGIDLNFLENVGLVGLSLDLNRFVDHFRKLSVPFVKFFISLEKGLVSRSVGLVLILKLKHSALELGYLAGELLFVLGKLFISPRELLVDSSTFFKSPVALFKIFLSQLVLLLQIIDHSFDLFLLSLNQLDLSFLVSDFYL
jgi:hypothetical protein